MPALRLLSQVAFAAASLVTLFGTPAFATDPSLDSAFVGEISPGLTPTSYPTFDNGTGAVNAVALQSDGKILAGGNVSRYKTSGELTALKRLLASGALDTSFNSGGAGLAATPGQPEVNAILRVAGDKLYVGGVFSSYNGIARSGVLRLNADGSLDTAFDLFGYTAERRMERQSLRDYEADLDLIAAALAPGRGEAAATSRAIPRAAARVA